MKHFPIALGILFLFGSSWAVATWRNKAEARLIKSETETAAPEENIALADDRGYCTADLKTILRRVLQSCGLSGGAGRGCQPVEAKTVATMSGDDFNALFLPMQDRGGIIQFEQGSFDLDEGDKKLVNEIFADRKGASYFFVVSRASPEGSNQTNSELSRSRAEQVMSHLKTTFQDPDIENQVGLLWLGEEFAQLNKTFCEWKRSGNAGGTEPNVNGCTSEEMNRSAFIAWIDCRL